MGPNLGRLLRWEHWGWGWDDDSHQLVIADGQVSHLAPVDKDHIKAALGLPAVDTQRVLAAAVQAAAIGIEEDTPRPGESWLSVLGT